MRVNKTFQNDRLYGDEILREVYAVRDAYAAEHSHDLNRIYADLKRTDAHSSLKHIVDSSRRKSRRRA